MKTNYKLGGGEVPRDKPPSVAHQYIWGNKVSTHMDNVIDKHTMCKKNLLMPVWRAQPEPNLVGNCLYNWTVRQRETTNERNTAFYHNVIAYRTWKLDWSGLVAQVGTRATRPSTIEHGRAKPPVILARPDTAMPEAKAWKFGRLKPTNSPMRLRVITRHLTSLAIQPFGDSLGKRHFSVVTVLLSETRK